MHNSGNGTCPSINVILALLKCCKAKSCDHLLFGCKVQHFIVTYEFQYTFSPYTLFRHVRVVELQVNISKFLSAFGRLWKTDYYLCQVLLSFCLSACNNSDPTGMTFIKFYMWRFFENPLRKFKFHWNLTKITLGYFTWRPMYMPGIATELRAARSGDRILVGTRFSSPVQAGPGVHPASCKMGTGSFPGVESGRSVTLTEV
jgi:hypothetical protein